MRWGCDQAMSDSVPATICGLQVVRLLGRGGFASVYLARTADGELRAVKQLHPERRSFARIVRAFEHEAEMLVNLDFPGVVRGLHFDRAEWAIVMEYLDGPTLEWVIANGLSRLPIHCRVFVGAELCDTLQAIHNQGWLHLDLKPNNVVLCRDGRVVLTDFGVAAALGVNDGEERPLLGTINYMSREQLTPGMTLDASADVFSLGVLLYELLAGTKPYRISKATELRKALERVAPLDSFGIAGLPVAVALAVQRAIAYNREARWRSAREFGELLRWELSGLSREDLVSELVAVVDELSASSGKEGESPVSGSPSPATHAGRQAAGPQIPAPQQPTRKRAEPGVIDPSDQKGRKTRRVIAACGLALAAATAGVGILAWGARQRPSPPLEFSPTPVAQPTLAAVMPPETPTPVPVQPSRTVPPTRAALGELRVNCIPNGEVISLRREIDGREFRHLVKDQYCPFPWLRLEEGRYTLVVQSSVGGQRIRQVVEVRGGQRTEEKVSFGKHE